MFGIQYLIVQYYAFFIEFNFYTGPLNEIDFVCRDTK